MTCNHCAIIDRGYEQSKCEGPTSLGKLLGVSKHRVIMWRKRNKISEKYYRAFHDLFGIPLEELLLGD